MRWKRLTIVGAAAVGVLSFSLLVVHASDPKPAEQVECLGLVDTEEGRNQGLEIKNGEHSDCKWLDDIELYYLISPDHRLRPGEITVGQYTVRKGEGAGQTFEVAAMFGREAVPYINNVNARRWNAFKRGFSNFAEFMQDNYKWMAVVIGFFGAQDIQMNAINAQLDMASQQWGSDFGVVMMETALDYDSGGSESDDFWLDGRRDTAGESVVELEPNRFVEFY